MENSRGRLTGARAATTSPVPQTTPAPWHSSTTTTLKLKAGYLFPEIARRVKAFTDANPDAAKRMIRCGIGDVTEPLPEAVPHGDAQGGGRNGDVREAFKGYGPEQGYEWLRKAIAENDYRAHGIDVADDEIFVCDGTKCDTRQHPRHPRRAERHRGHRPGVSRLCGHERDGRAHRRGGCARRVRRARLSRSATTANGFVAAPPQEKVDVDLPLLAEQPDRRGGDARAARSVGRIRACERQSLILFDAAYEAYISEPGVPHSIYEIPGARECAIEFRSFSKNGGFTGVRCAFIVVPKTLMATTASGEKQAAAPAVAAPADDEIQRRRVHRPARRRGALFAPRARRRCARSIEHYMGNARVLREAANGRGLRRRGAA